MSAARSGARARSFVAGTAVLLLAGCATFSPDGGFDRVAELTRERAGHAPRWQRSDADADAARQRVAELLREPLRADAAVEIALLNHAGLQADLHELGIAESDLVRAGRMRNPTFSFSRLAGGGHLEIERALIFDVLSLLTMPLAVEAEQRRFARTQLEIAGRAVAVAAEARRAWTATVASQELVRYYEQVKEAADASAELARRMVEAGNFSKLAMMREQAFYADATTQLARARHQAHAERERLARALGLHGEQLAFTLADRLPDLPAAPLEPRDAERTAIETRLDVLAAKRGAEAVARALELNRATGFVNVLHGGYVNASESDEERKDGFELELELPIFDFGATRTARAEATYRQALQRTAEVATNARSEVRDAYSAYRTSYDIARHYRDEIVPLRKRISEENLLRYNGMLIGIFELLADAREQVASVTAAVEAVRDFWLADTNLQVALTSGSPGAATAVQRPAAAPAGGSGGH
ncbi:MAG: copper resistance-related lipoprotein [Betaproteobacteria bacterium]|nr:MAG: copper resistance-related lipoprotein [Betaproteobacteria bacterium]